MPWVNWTADTWNRYFPNYPISQRKQEQSHNKLPKNTGKTTAHSLHSPPASAWSSAESVCISGSREIPKKTGQRNSLSTARRRNRRNPSLERSAYLWAICRNQAGTSGFFRNLLFNAICYTFAGAARTRSQEHSCCRHWLGRICRSRRRGRSNYLPRHSLSYHRNFQRVRNGSSL